MKILVDADACPVKDIIVRVARVLSIPVIMFIDTSHFLNDGYSTVITVDKGKDSVDFALINKVEKGDIVVTQDYGLAAMVISKSTHAINNSGLIFNENNIDGLLFQRHISQKIRNSGGRTSNPRKRLREDDEKFEKSFKSLCQKLIGGNE